MQNFKTSQGHVERNSKALSQSKNGALDDFDVLCLLCFAGIEFFNNTKVLYWQMKNSKVRNICVRYYEILKLKFWLRVFFLSERIFNFVLLTSDGLAKFMNSKLQLISFFYTKNSNEHKLHPFQKQFAKILSFPKVFEKIFSILKTYKFTRKQKHHKNRKK